MLLKAINPCSMKSIIQFSLRAAALLVFAIPLLVIAGANAQSSGAIAQGFTPDSGKGTIVGGALVSFVSRDAKRVELATAESASRLAGVVDANPLLAISATSRTVQVVHNGPTTV